MSRIFRYILATDNGMAPCSDKGWVSLATCKPQIRRSAKPGEWVVGFYPSPAPRGLVAWAGRVARRVEIADYESEFRGRSDAVYRMMPDGNFKRLRPDYHPGPDQFRKDTSAPVLVFDKATTWYFGDRPQMLPDSLMNLAPRGIGHRVNGTADGDVANLLAWLRQVALPGVHGRPRDAKRSAASCAKC
jgi:hypothetical protein